MIHLNARIFPWVGTGKYDGLFVLIGYAESRGLTLPSIHSMFIDFLLMKSSLNMSMKMESGHLCAKEILKNERI